MKFLLAFAIALFTPFAPVLAMSSTTPITADQIQQAAKTSAAVAQIFACDVSAAADVALVAEQAANMGATVVRTGTTTKVVNVSTTLCSTLGGVASTIAASAVPAN
jgi:hypothetical protein